MGSHGREMGTEEMGAELERVVSSVKTEVQPEREISHVRTSNQNQNQDLLASPGSSALGF